MQPTVPPWWQKVQQTRRVLLPRAHYRAHNIHFNWSRPRNADITLYFGRDDPARVFRLENTLGQSRLFPTRGSWHDRYPLDMDLWRQPLPTPPELKFDLGATTDGAGIASGAYPVPKLDPPSGWWESAARGWVVGTLVLVVLVIIVRAMEKCLDRRLFKAERRRSEEWSRPNVLATSGQGINDFDNRLENSDVFPADPAHGISNDLPPPYSECANGEVNATNAGSTKLEITHEEPPPPYSACYVAFLNPKDGIPSVHLFNSRRPNFDASNTSADTRINVVTNGNIGETSVASSSLEFSGHYNIENENAELVFENGRIIERSQRATDLSTNSNVQLNSTINNDSINKSTDNRNEHVINM